MLGVILRRDNESMAPEVPRDKKAKSMSHLLPLLPIVDQNQNARKL